MSTKSPRGRASTLSLARERSFRVCAAALLFLAFLRYLHAVLPACFNGAPARAGSLSPVRFDARSLTADEISLVPGVGDAMARKIVARLGHVTEMPRDLSILESIPGVGPRIRVRLERELHKTPLQQRE